MQQVGDLIPPPWLDEIGRGKFVELATSCLWITPVDAVLLALFADSYARFVSAQQLAIRRPLVRQEVRLNRAKGSNSRTTTRLLRNPASILVHECIQQVRSLGSELGLSPSARGGMLGGRKPGPADPAERYFHD